MHFFYFVKMLLISIAQVIMEEVSFAQKEWTGMSMEEGFLCTKRMNWDVMRIDLHQLLFHFKNAFMKNIHNLACIDIVCNCKTYAR